MQPTRISNPSIYGISRSGLCAIFAQTAPADKPLSKTQQLGRARQVLQRIYRSDAAQAPDSSEAPDSGESALTAKPVLSRSALRAFGSDYNWEELPIELVHKEKSVHDGSIKLVLRSVATGLLFESVLLPERGRLTQCVSSQVGCAQGCRFCQTGRMGLKGNLSAAEIVSQVVLGNQIWAREQGSVQEDRPWDSGKAKVTNVVFMGMGEPLDNLDAVLGACEVMTEPWGLGIGAKKITISTVGLPDGMRRVLAESPYHLALSLHSPFDDQRSKMMPVNEKHGIDEILEVLRTCARRKDHFLIQYTLIRNVNDSMEHASHLAQKLLGIRAKVNLIPLNEHDGAAFRRPFMEGVLAFQNALKKSGLVATIRFSKGGDIDAACGQLVKKRELL